MCRLCNSNENFTRNICKNCYDNTPSTFNKNNIPYRIYILHCNLNHLYISNSSNTLCPICYKKQVYCKTCNKLLDYKVLENDFSNHFCSPICRNKLAIKNNTSNGICVICNKYSNKRDATGKCIQCSNNFLQSKKDNGNCVICGIFNEKRDQNGRGISNCNCSKEWFKKHNSSKQMKEISKLNGINSGSKNLQNFIEKRKIESLNKIFERRKYLEERNNKIEYLKDKYNYPNKNINYQYLLCSARNSGFKTSDPFLDIENFLIKVQKINEDLEQYKKKQLNYFNKIKNNYTLNNIPINLENKNILKQNYLNNPGVIFLWGFKDNINYCLTGGQTKNLYSHILFFLKYSDKNKIKFCKKDNRWYEIANNYNNFSIVIVNENNFNLQDREIIETNYAVNNKALFWKPSITQISYYKNILNV